MMPLNEVLAKSYLVGWTLILVALPGILLLAKRAWDVLKLRRAASSWRSGSRIRRTHPIRWKRLLVAGLLCLMAASCSWQC